MEYKEAYFNGKDGSSRFFRTWSPDENSKGLVIISHGYAEHSGRYEDFARRLLSEGFSVWAHDHYGHGNSEGPRALIQRIELAAEDMRIAVETAAALHGNSPVFLFGHSMGGAIAALTALKSTKNLRGLVLSGAAVRIQDTSPALVRGIARIFRLFAPSLPLLPFHTEKLSHSREVLKNYHEDPLNYTGKMKVAMGLEMIEAERILSARALAGISLPTLIVHGGDDAIVPPESSRKLYEELGSEDKTLRIFDEAYHELHNEACAQEYFSLLGQWLKAHLE